MKPILQKLLNRRECIRIMESVKAITTSFGTYRTLEEADLLFQKYENSLKEEFFEKGEKQNAIEYILSMFKNGIPVSNISKITNKSTDEIENILNNNITF